MAVYFHHPGSLFTMVRRYNSHRYYVNRDKYAIEQSAGNLILPNTDYDANVVVVPASSTQGMRKVKHLTVTLANTTTTGSTDCFWALVYVPDGTLPNQLSIGANASNVMYSPAQFVMACGLAEFSGGPLRIHTPLSRNLNTGDAIYLVIKNQTPGAHIGYVCRYAVTLQ